MSGDKIKNLLTKLFSICIMTGFILLLVPGFNSRVSGAYSPDEDTDYTIDITKSDLNDIYDFQYVAEDYLSYYYYRYDKSGYTSAAYKKLTNYYNEAVKAVKNDFSLKSAKSVYKKYLKLIKSVKPSILIKYQKKMKKKVTKTYNKLVKKYDYSDTNLEILNDIKLAGIENIAASTIKTDAKKEMSSCVIKLKAVKTYVQQVKDDAISFIESNKNIEQSEKESLIKKINKEAKTESITDLLRQYGYSYEDYIETNPNKLTLDILYDDAKLDEFAKKWIEEYTDHLGYYFSLDGEFTTYDWTSVKFMIYMLNYKYCVPEKAFSDLDEAMEYEYDSDANIYIEMCVGGSLIEVEFGSILDYDTLIIESNDIKGVGKLLNDIERAIVDGNQEKLEELFVEYFDNYMCKNAVIDTIVYEFIREYTRYESDFRKNNKESISKIYTSSVQILIIEKELFLNEYEKKYNKAS